MKPIGSGNLKCDLMEDFECLNAQTGILGSCYLIGGAHRKLRAYIHRVDGDLHVVQVASLSAYRSGSQRSDRGRRCG